MGRFRNAVTRLLVAIGAMALVFAGSAAARGQTDDCGDHACAVATSQSSGDIKNDSGAVLVEGDGGSASVDNGSGATVVHADDGSPSVVNDSGAVFVESDGGSPSVVNGSGAVDVEANGASPSVVNDSGAVLVEGEGRVVPSVRTPTTEFVQPLPFHRFLPAPRVTRLPTTGAPLSAVLVLAIGMVGLGALLLGSARFARRFATAPAVMHAGNVTAMRAAVLF